MEILSEIASYWGGCIEDAKAACLASHLLRHLYQPLIFRVITIIDRDQESTATMVCKLLDALERNRTLGLLVHELEWRVDFRSLSQHAGIPRLFSQLQEIKDFHLTSAGAFRMAWNRIPKDHQEAIFNLCQRPSLQSLRLSNLIQVPYTLVFNQSLRITRLSVYGIIFDDDDSSLEVCLQASEYLASLQHFNYKCSGHMLADPLTLRWINASTSSPFLESFEQDIYVWWHGGA